MPTRKQLANLKRGGAPATPEAAARARAAKERHADNDKELADLAAEDPWAAYEELHRLMTAHMLRLLRSEAKGGRPSRDVTDRLREYRQTTEALSAYRASRGTDVDRERFFEELEERLASGRINLSAQANPYLEHPGSRE